jgi:hypothetical protein
MENLKLYQYKDLVKVDSFTYNGKLATELIDDSKYNISSPVTTTENVEEVTDSVILTDTLSNQSGQLKFNFSFKVHSDILGTGTKFVCGIPGLMEVKADDNVLAFLFGFEDTPIWKYCRADDLITGWNEISLDSDGAVIDVTINSKTITLLDTTQAYITRTISGFNEYHYYNFGKLPASITSLKFIARCSVTSTTTRHNILLSASDAGYQYGYNIRYTTSKPSIYCNQWYDGAAAVSPNTYYWYAIIKSGNDYLYYTIQDNDYKIDSLPDFSNWTLQVTNPNEMSNLTWILGNNTMTSGQYWTGTIDQLKFEVNGTTIFDLYNDADAQALVTQGGLTVTEEQYGPVYPDITTQELYTKQSWLYLKDIEAINVDESN